MPACIPIFLFCILTIVNIMTPTFFPTQAAFRKWLKKNHEKEKELLVGFYKVNSGKASITWPQAVDEALCFGWIDGIRKSIDKDSYTNRFTPRKAKSNWSNINIRRVGELSEAGLMQPAGTEAFKKREEAKSGQYSFEQKEIKLGAAYEKLFKKNKKAWIFFQSQVQSYRKPAIWWVISAKLEDTREKRLTILINDSEAGKKIAPLRRTTDPK